jgi:hypothetical protein
MIMCHAAIGNQLGAGQRIALLFQGALVASIEDGDAQSLMLNFDQVRVGAGGAMGHPLTQAAPAAVDLGLGGYFEPAAGGAVNLVCFDDTGAPAFNVLFN